MFVALEYQTFPPAVLAAFLRYQMQLYDYLSVVPLLLTVAYYETLVDFFCLEFFLEREYETFPLAVLAAFVRHQTKVDGHLSVVPLLSTMAYSMRH